MKTLTSHRTPTAVGCIHLFWLARLVMSGAGLIRWLCEPPNHWRTESKPHDPTTNQAGKHEALLPYPLGVAECETQNEDQTNHHESMKNQIETNEPPQSGQPRESQTSHHVQESPCPQSNEEQVHPLASNSSDKNAASASQPQLLANQDSGCNATSLQSDSSEPPSLPEELASNYRDYSKSLKTFNVFWGATGSGSQNS